MQRDINVPKFLWVIVVATPTDAVATPLSRLTVGVVNCVEKVQGLYNRFTAQSQVETILIIFTEITACAFR